jgi:hypothetical protein
LENGVGREKNFSQSHLPKILPTIGLKTALALAPAVVLKIQIPMAPLGGTHFASRSRSYGNFEENSRFSEFKRTLLSIVLNIARFAL